ncbi:MAG TPA: hypothetical protein VHC20_06805 [Candidatus Paceibacterota bacterium]|nr:hypothetical protein [Candidatus Paceibacterota bacterium]
MTDDRIAFTVWLASSAVLVPIGFIAAAKMKAPHFRLVRAVVRAVPLAWLFTPSIAFGFIALPVPAAVMVIGSLLLKIRGENPVQGPNLASLPFAKAMLVGVAVLLTLLFYVPALIKYFAERKSRKNA